MLKVLLFNGDVLLSVRDLPKVGAMVYRSAIVDGLKGPRPPTICHPGWKRLYLSPCVVEFLDRHHLKPCTRYFYRLASADGQQWLGNCPTSTVFIPDAQGEWTVTSIWVPPFGATDPPSLAISFGPIDIGECSSQYNFTLPNGEGQIVTISPEGNVAGYIPLSSTIWDQKTKFLLVVFPYSGTLDGFVTLGCLRASGSRPLTIANVIPTFPFQVIEALELFYSRPWVVTCIPGYKATLSISIGSKEIEVSIPYSNAIRYNPSSGIVSISVSKAYPPNKNYISVSLGLQKPTSCRISLQYSPIGHDGHLNPNKKKWIEATVS